MIFVNHKPECNLCKHINVFRSQTSVCFLKSIYSEGNFVHYIFCLCEAYFLSWCYVTSYIIQLLQMSHVMRKPVYADQPAHPRSLISAFVVHCRDSIIPLLPESKIWRLYLASDAELVGLNFTWWHTSEDRFSHDVAQTRLCCGHQCIVGLGFVVKIRMGPDHIAYLMDIP